MTDSERIEEIRSRLRHAAPPGSLVLLFGTRARCYSSTDPDFHILVVEPHVDRAMDEAVRLRRELRGLGAPIDLTVMGQQRFRRRATVVGTTANLALQEGELLAYT